jgi:hypothetical protein
MAGIHRYGFTILTAPIPGTSPVLTPLVPAPGVTVSAFYTGTPTLASLFTDAALTLPLANPFVSDANAFYQYFTDPTLGDIDEQFSGGGIVTPYTIPMVLDLDPRILGTSGTVTGLAAALAAEVSLRAAQVLALQQIGVRYPLGGSLVEGIESGVTTDVFNPIIVTVNGTQFAGYTMTVFVEGYSADGIVTVTPLLLNLTTSVVAGTGTPIAANTRTAQSFTATIAAGVNQYILRLTPSAGTQFVYLNGYVSLAHP